LTHEGKEQEMNSLNIQKGVLNMESPKWSCNCNEEDNRLVAFRVSRITVQEEVIRIERLTLHERLQEQHTIYFSFVCRLSYSRTVLNCHFHASHHEYW
jgi:hypothetical protein